MTMEAWKWERIDDAIHRWHETRPAVELHEYLGMTCGEYEVFVTDKVLPEGYTPPGSEGRPNGEATSTGPRTPESPGRTISSRLYEHVFVDVGKSRMTDETKVTIDETMADFAEAWKALPPLVRASVALHMVSELDRYEERGVRYYFMEKESMPRRARVTKRFLSGYEALRHMMVLLANEADAEAEAMGIDADERYEGEEDPVREILVRHGKVRDDRGATSWKWERAQIKADAEEEVLAKAGEAVAAKIDKEVVAELGKASKDDDS